MRHRQLGGEAADPGQVLARDRFSVPQERFLPGFTYLHLATQTDSSGTKCIQTSSRYAGTRNITVTLQECPPIFNFIFALHGSSICYQLSGQDLHHGYLAGRPPRLHLPRPRHRRRQQPKSQAVFYEDFHNLRWQIRVAVVGLQVVIASQPTL